MKYIFTLLIALSVLFVGCDSTASKVDTAERSDRVEALDQALLKQFKAIGQNISQNESTTLADLGGIMQSFYLETYGPQSSEFAQFAASYKSSSTVSATVTLAPAVQDVVSRVQDAVAASPSYDAFASQMAVIESSVLSSDMTASDKEQALTYVVGMNRTMEFLNDYAADLTPSFAKDESDEEMEEPEGWWESWGKCAAGTIGGTLTGGLAGAGIGSAVPVIGTTTGGISGAIGGGLTGAAEYC